MAAFILSDDLKFLAAGGEMGELMRNKDWGANALGKPDHWPQSLRTTLSILLHSSFPMVLFWGPELICFYNDAFRPSLGNDGKHPSILGARGEDAWAEIWTTIKPWMDAVLLEGKAIWNEDMLVPIYRNGKIEEVYWTFSYSPVHDETGNPAGVFAAVVETTEKVNNLKRIAENEQALKESAENLGNMVRQAPIGICILDAATLVSEIANDRFVEIAGKPYEAIAGKFYWDTFAEAREYYEPAMKQVVETGITYHADEVKLMLIRHEREEQIYATFVYAPLKDKDGKVNKVTVWVLENTKQVEARKKIEEAEQKTTLALNSAELGLYEINYATDEMITDERFKEIWGVKKSVSRKDYVGNIHQDDLVQRAEAHELAFSTGQLDYKARIVWDDGTLHWTRITGKVIYDEEKKPVKLIGVVQDINAAVIAQNKIEESERDLRSIIIQAPVAMCIFRGAEYTIEIANNKMFELWGRTRAETEGKPVFEALPEVRGHGFEEMLQGVFTTGKRFNGNEQPVPLLRDGKVTTVYVNFVYEPMKKGDGTVWGILAVAVDVSPQVVARRQIEEVVAERTEELKELNNILKKSEERYHLMVEEVQDYAIIYLNPEGIVENWNLGAEKIKGYTEEEIVGRNFSTFYTGEDRKINMPKTMLERAREHGRAVQEGWRVRKNGNLFWASVVITAVHDETGAVIGFSKVTHDLTDKKAAEDKLKINAAELELKNIELQRMNKELESFAYISSHDLQEPLRKIQTFSSQILEREASNLSEVGKFKFGRMLHAAVRMQTLIGDLLAYSRTSTGERKFEEVNLGEIVESVKEDLGEELHRKQATIEVGAMCPVNIIPFQFRQLFYNLIINALKFSREDVAPRILIQCEISSGVKLNNEKLDGNVQYAHISIADNGIGFETQYKDKIFQVFQRLHGHDEYTGTGIGLAIVKKIVENHNGVITAEGETDKGATFHIYLPVG